MSDSTAFVFYKYNPNNTAALTVAILFGILTVLHAFRLIKARTWYFIPFVFGGLFEIGGYGARYVSGKEKSGEWTVMPYAIQSSLLLLAPALLAASIYMVLGRIIQITGGEHLSPIRIKRLTKIFVMGDVLSFFVQSAGGGLLTSAKTPSAVNLGNNIIKAGLFVQIIFFGFFMVVTTLFHIRISKTPTTTSVSLNVPWQRQMIVLYAASILIMIRSLYRLIEYIQGSDSVLMSTEAYLYGLDASLMVIVMGLFVIFHPSKVTRNAKYTSFDEETQSIAMHPRPLAKSSFSST